jgi:RNA polymerase sigma factor (TIGR02999 family)
MENAEITQLLGEAREGKPEAHSRLAAVVYGELHRLAVYHMHNERPDHSLQATVLVDEAFMRLIGSGDRNWQNRAHFFAAAAQVMRRILIDYARNRRTEKRGGGRWKVDLEKAAVFSNENCEEWIAVDQALGRLAQRDARMARIVELRYFAGLTEEEVAEALVISARTVKRDWRVAREWLRADLSTAQAHE